MYSRDEGPQILDYIGMKSDPTLDDLRRATHDIAESKMVLSLEKVALQVIGSKDTAYEEIGDSGWYDFKETRLGCSLREWMWGAGILKPAYDYSAPLLALLHSVLMIKSMYDLKWKELGDPGSLRGRMAMNQIVDQIRYEAGSRWYANHGKRQREMLRLRSIEIANHARLILNSRARTLVVRVDLGYRLDAQRELTVDQAFRHREMLTSRIRNSEALKHLTGFAWAWHQGSRRGYHLHTVFYFDGSQHRQDITLGEHIGRLWSEVTAESGNHYNCNMSADSYPVRGLGMIQRSDRIACDGVVHAAQYLGIQQGREAGEFNQYMRVRPMGARTFGKSIPPASPIPIGRPRQAGLAADVSPIYVALSDQ